MYSIENHRLYDDEPDCGVTHITNRVAPLIEPRIIVIHYGVTHSLGALVAAQRHRNFWAHLSIDGFVDDHGGVYQVTQALPFNQRGSHAGKSSYKGVSSCNGFSIGIEIANPGPLVEKNGELETVYGKRWPRDQAYEGRHKYKHSPPTWKHWALYTDQELDILVETCHLLRKQYPTIVDVVGHDDIAPGRKFDPGPAFPMDWLREEIFGGEA